MRRTRCTTSCEVQPGSLSINSRPSFMRRSSEHGLELFGHLLAHRLAVAFEGEAGGVPMTAAAVMAGDLFDVDLAAAPERYLVRAVLALADQGHRLDPGDRPHVV